MNYQNYEEYMRSVLGYSPYTDNNYTYSEQEDYVDYYGNQALEQQPSQDLTKYYPEIYKMIYPMVCKVCNLNFSKEFTKELLEEMTEKIYKVVEPEESIDINSRLSKQPMLKNGDVINPNAKEPEIQTRDARNNNNLLKDLIRILLLKEWQRPVRPPIRPPMGPSMIPPPPIRPTRPPMGIQQRPRYY